MEAGCCACTGVKSGTENHVKMKRLMRALSIPQYQAVGIMESIWLMCQACCEYGDIGKYTDEEIAAYIGWERDASELVRALAAAGWIDPDVSARWVIHDWLDEAPEFIWDRIRKRKAREERTGKAHGESKKRRSLTTYDDKPPDMSGAVRAVPGRDPESPGYQTKPNQDKPNPTDPPPDALPPPDDPPAQPPAAGSVCASRDAIAFGKFKGTSLAFQTAWDSYPPAKRTRKVEAQVAWDEAVDVIMIRDHVERYKAEDWLLRRIREFAKSPAAQSEFCVHVATWIKSGKYDDPPEAWQSKDKEAKAKEPKPSMYPKLTPPQEHGSGPAKKFIVAKNAPAPAGAAASGSANGNGKGPAGEPAGQPVAGVRPGQAPAGNDGRVLRPAAPPGAGQLPSL